MKTIISEPTESNIKIAAEIIKNGGTVAFPTETVYGLGVSALDENAAKKVYEAKGRPSDNPLIIHLADYQNASHYAYTTDEFYRLAGLFMPGPITVILKKKDCIPFSITGGLSTVAVRVPSNETAHKLIEYAGVPIAAPSANISGRPSCTTAEHVIKDMNGRIDMILAGEDCKIGLESTIVMFEGSKIKMLRPGAITVEMLNNAGFEVSLDKAVTEKLGDGEKPLAPGMKYRHYAPKASVILLDGDRKKVDEFFETQKGKDGVAFICFDEEKRFDAKNTVYIGNANDSEEQAHRLFAILREFDENESIKVIYARMPKKNDIGLAIYNRMLKASGYTIKIID